MTAPAYPLPSRSEEDHWPMSRGLVEDVAEALARHGYPPIPVSWAAAADYVRLRQHLWHFITGRECDVLDADRPGVPAQSNTTDDEPDRVDDDVAKEHYQRAFDAVALVMSGGGEVAATPSREFYAYVVDEVCLAVAYDRLRTELTRLRADNLGLDRDLAQARGDLGDAQAEIDRLRDESERRLTKLFDRISGLERERTAALFLIDDLMSPADQSYGVYLATWLTQLRAALGAADEPTTGGGSDA